MCCSHSHKARPVVVSSWPLILFIFLFSCGREQQNRLSNATSPYLKEHADNPVDWYEWGEEALEKASKENKPLLISIGYASCHWCHEMEKESFMDTAVARIMNESFVCIKVDREERPDIDNIYSNACQLISGSSGWPLNAFALPDGKPFFAGTYYSKKAWISLLSQIEKAYRQQPGKVQLQAQSLAMGIQQQELSLLADSLDSPMDKLAYQVTFDSVYKNLDTINGGIKGAPKFPSPYLAEYLLQHHYLTGSTISLDAAHSMLTSMALSAMSDQVGGGFSRYTVDSLWRVPHFEKMLVDNAQLMSVYSHAYQVTRNELYKDIVTGIAGFVRTELTGPAGEFYSSLNADTKDGEGEFYAFTPAQMEDPLVAEYFHVTEKGNWKEGKSLLFATMTPIEFARYKKLDSSIFINRLRHVKEQLQKKRNLREKPSLDHKVITSWNALMMKGYLDAYAATGDESFLGSALENAQFLEKNIFTTDGKIWRCVTDGIPTIDGLLEDYAFLGEAFIRLYQLTFDKRWLDMSYKLVQQTKKRFYDERSGLYFTSPPGTGKSEIQHISLVDNSPSSPNAVLGKIYYFLGVYYQEDELVEASKKMLSKLKGHLEKEKAIFYTSWGYLAGLHAFGLNEVAIMGKEAGRLNVSLQTDFLPLSAFMGSTEEENLPLLKGQIR